MLKVTLDILWKFVSVETHFSKISVWHRPVAESERQHQHLADPGTLTGVQPEP